MAAVIVMSVPAGLCASAPKPAKVSPASTPVQGRVSSVGLAQAPAAIPFAEVAKQATDVANYLITLTAQGGGCPEVAKVQEQFSAQNARIEQDYVGTMSALQEQVTLEKLQGYTQLWKKDQLQLSQWLAVLTGCATRMQATLRHLDLLQKSWTLTRQAAEGENAPPQFVQQINAVLDGISLAQAPLKARNGAILATQELVAGGLARCGKVIAAVNEAQKKAVGGILAQDSSPLWSDELRARAETELPGRIQAYLNRYRENIANFISDPAQGLPQQMGLFAFLVVLFIMMRHKVSSWQESEDRKSHFTIFQRPYAAALVGTLLAGSGPFFPSSHEVQTLMQVLTLLPAIYLILPSLDKHVLPPIVALAALFALDTGRQGLAGTPLLEQGILIVETVSGIAVLWWSRSRRAFKCIPQVAGVPSRVRAASWVALIIMVILAVSLGGVMFGYIRLARLLASGVLVGGVLALSIYIQFMILYGFMAFLIRLWPLRSLRMVENHTPLLERRLRRLLILVAIFSWLIRYLSYIGLLSPAVSFMKSVLTARVKHGAFSISIEDILAFVLTVWLALLVSSFIRFALNEDVFPRVSMSRGVSYAVSNLMRYLIIVIGFVVGVGMLGLTLDRVIILISAFGVGIGFGLQTVVNNFISGLILLFEQPVHIGDTVEFGAIFGEVRQIGIRSSKVHTWQGAVIIVPNSQLVTESVINWTFSDKLRRIDLPLGVNYGADPRQVIALLQEVAEKNPFILSSPPCVCLFTGFGDSTINFEIRAWTDQFSNWYQIRSELGVAVYNAVRGAGMSFPFPQREVHLIRDPELQTGSGQQS